MNLECVEKIAEAVLYEGYMLYPYRASNVKNRQRWNFGVLYPRLHCERQCGSDSWMTQTECLLQADSSTRLDVEIRFLQIVNRSVGKLSHPLRRFSHSKEAEIEVVDKLVVDGQRFTSWQEAIERKVKLATLHPTAIALQRQRDFEFPSKRELELIRSRDGDIQGVIIREWKRLTGAVEVKLQRCPHSLTKITVRLRNLTAEPRVPDSHADVLMHSLVSAHTILGAEGGQFLSLLDPPANFKYLAAECVNLGTWPVLVGEEGAHVMLSSPIILYDYPQIAPESPGNLFDGTEIDEILSLRILAMTDEEKSEMRQSDERTRQILERTESMPPEQFMKLHGVLRGLRASVEEAP
jgi:hydrogenase maturation protease